MKGVLEKIDNKIKLFGIEDWLTVWVGNIVGSEIVVVGHEFYGIFLFRARQSVVWVCACVVSFMMHQFFLHRGFPSYVEKIFFRQLNCVGINIFCWSQEAVKSLISPCTYSIFFLQLDCVGINSYSCHAHIVGTNSSIFGGIRWTFIMIMRVGIRKTLHGFILSVGCLFFAGSFLFLYIGINNKDAFSLRNGKCVSN
jgi:hypothetical protein